MAATSLTHHGLLRDLEEKRNLPGATLPAFRMPSSSHTQVHGHRGCEGPVPANTIPAFLMAAATGCTWLEMDVVITGDRRVLVSHEPWMDHHVCRDPDGVPISEEEGRAINIFMLPLEEVQRFGCVPTSLADSPISPQENWHKPTLAEVVRAVDAYVPKSGKPPPSFNIEIKSEPQLYGTFQPQPVAFAELVLLDVIALGIEERCIIQSFDTAVLEAVHTMAPEVPIALLVDNADGLEANLRRLSFKPAYFSPAFSLANPPLAAELREKGIGLLVWTVNHEADMLRMLDLSVDGLITDKPAEALSLIAARQ